MPSPQSFQTIATTRGGTVGRTPRRDLNPVVTEIRLAPWIHGQVRVRKAAKRFSSVWTLGDFRGRDLVPRLEESITAISAQPWWRFNPYALTVQARDLRDEQDHEGYIKIDPTCPNRGARTVPCSEPDLAYKTSEGSAQNLLKASRQSNSNSREFVGMGAMNGIGICRSTLVEPEILELSARRILPCTDEKS